MTIPMKDSKEAPSRLQKISDLFINMAATEEIYALPSSKDRYRLNPLPSTKRRKSQLPVKDLPKVMGYIIEHSDYYNPGVYLDIDHIQYAEFCSEAHLTPTDILTRIHSKVAKSCCNFITAIGTLILDRLFDSNHDLTMTVNNRIRLCLVACIIADKTTSDHPLSMKWWARTFKYPIDQLLRMEIEALKLLKFHVNMQWNELHRFIVKSVNRIYSEDADHEIFSDDEGEDALMKNSHSV